MIFLRIGMKPDNSITPPPDKKTALSKAENYCAYQERSQQEVRDKLYGYGLKSADVEDLIAELIQNNFLNEERFAIAYCLGKFRMKHWGKLKIRQGLKAKQVSPKIIESALRSIDPDEYIDILRILLEKKGRSVKEPNLAKKKLKLVQYAASKGFEKDLIFDLLNSSDLL